MNRPANITPQADAHRPSYRPTRAGADNRVTTITPALREYLRDYMAPVRHREEARHDAKQLRQLEREQRVSAMAKVNGGDAWDDDAAADRALNPFIGWTIGIGFGTLFWAVVFVVVTL